MNYISFTNQNIENILRDIYSKDVPLARSTLILDIFSFQYTFLITTTDKTILNVQIKTNLFTSSKPSDTFLSECLSSTIPSSLHPFITETITLNNISLSISIPNSKPHLEDLILFLSDFTAIFLQKLLLKSAKTPLILSIDESSFLFSQEKENSFLIAFGYTNRDKLDIYLLKNMGDQFEVKKSKGGSSIPIAQYIEPPHEKKSIAFGVLKDFEKEKVEICNSGFLSFSIGKNAKDFDNVLKKVVKLKAFFDLEMKGMKTMMNGKMRGNASELTKKLNRTKIVP